MNQYEKIKSTCYVTEEDHKYYKNDGTPIELQSVSKLVEKVYPGTYNEIPEEILKAAGLRGMCVHGRMEIYIKTGIVEKCSHGFYKHDLMFNRLKDKIDHMNYDHIFSEVSLYNEFYTGTFDLLIVKNDSVIMYDFKTTSRPHKEKELLQMTFYSKLLEENFDIKTNHFAIMNSNVDEYYGFSEEDTFRENENYLKVMKQEFNQ